MRLPGIPYVTYFLLSSLLFPGPHGKGRAGGGVRASTGVLALNPARGNILLTINQ